MEKDNHGFESTIPFDFDPRCRDWVKVKSDSCELDCHDS